MPQGIRKNIVYNFIKTCSSLLFPLITFRYISATLGPDALGHVEYGQSVVNYFTLIATLGITTYAIRECSAVRESKEKLSITAGEIFSINVVTSVIAYVLLAGLLLVGVKLRDYRLLIVLQSTSIVLTTLGADWLNSAMEDFRYITIRTVAFQFLALLLMFLLVHSPEDYLIYAVITVISTSGANVVNIWYRRRYCKVAFTLNIPWKKHLPPILLLFVMLLSQTIFSNADKTMLGLMKGDYEVGIYSATVKIGNIVRQFVQSIIWVLMPRMSLYFAEEDFESANKLLRRVFSFTAVLGIPCVVGCSVMAEEVIRILSEEKFLPAMGPLRILMLAMFFSFFGGCFIGNIILLPAKKEKPYMIVCVITALFNVVTNALLIPRFGVAGATLTTAASELLILVCLYPHIDKRIDLGGIGSLLRGPVAGSMLILLFCLAVKRFGLSLWPRTVVCVGGSVLLYAVVLLLMKDETAVEITGLLKNRLHKAR